LAVNIENKRGKVYNNTNTAYYTRKETFPGREDAAGAKAAKTADSALRKVISER
jgi:hypothetical protein